LAIKKAQANYDNGTTFDTLHYETQASQVKVVDATGNVVSDLSETLLNGKTLTGVSILSVRSTGRYFVVNPTGSPITPAIDTAYQLEVTTMKKASGTLLTIQVFYDHRYADVYRRVLDDDATTGSWVRSGKFVSDFIKSVGDPTALTTQSKAVVGAINEVKSALDNTNNVVIKRISDEITGVTNALNAHNHDDRYLKLIGGNVTSTLSVANNKSLAGRDSSGATDLNIGKVNTTSDVVLGDTKAKSIIQTKDNNLYVTNGTNTYKVLHTGNDGAGSGLDADRIDGIEGEQLARQDSINYYTQDQIIDNSKSMILKATSGAGNAGSIYWKLSDGTIKGKIGVSASSEMYFTANGLTGHRIQADGKMESIYDHVLNAKERQVAIRFKLDDNDEGAGFYMNNNTKQVGFFDWKYGEAIFRTDREDQTVKFTNSIFVQNHKLSIQSTAPSKPATDDIWIAI